MGKPVKRMKPKDGGRRRKKVSVLVQEKVDYVDWKDVNLLRKFMSDRAKIRARRVTGNDNQQQREIARAIKNAREMALLPYTNRVITQRGGKRGDRDRDGDDRPRRRRDEDGGDGPTLENAGATEFPSEKAAAAAAPVESVEVEA